MASLASINVKFQVDLKQFSTEMQSAMRSIDKFGQKMQSVGRSMSAAITLPVLAAGAGALKMASDYEESLNKVNVAFRGSSDEVKTFAKTTLNAFGIAEGTALDMASTFGDMGTSLGLTTDQSAKMSTSLVGLAGDLSSFKNIGIEQANTALTGIFTGETESLKKLGIVMTEANLQNFAYSQGIQTNIQDMDQASKVQLRYNYIMSVTKNAQGDFARTSGGAANQMRIFQETLKQVGQQFGSIILPMFTGLLQKVNGAITAFGNLDAGTKKIILVVAGLAAAIGPVVFAIGAISSAIPAMVVGFTALAGPIGLVVAGLAAVAYVVANNWDDIKAAFVDLANYFVDLYNSSTVFRAGVEYVIFSVKTLLSVAKGVFSDIASIATLAGKIIFDVFKTVGGLIKGVLTFDVSLIKSSLAKGFEGISASVKTFRSEVNKVGKGVETDLAKNALEGINNVMNGSKVKKLTIAKDKVDAKGVETAVEESVVSGAGKGAKKVKIKRADIEGVDKLELKGSNSAGAKFDEEISRLKRFRDEVAQTADQIKSANDAIAQVEFAKDIKFDPSKIIKGNIDGVAEKLAGQAAGMTTSMNLVSLTAQKMQETVAEAALPALTDAFSSMGAGVVGALGLAQNGFEGFIGGLANTITKLISMMLAAAISQSIPGAVAAGTATGPLAVFTTPAFITTAVSGVVAAFAAIPKFETGGVVGGSSYYGDKILARVNSGEMILNSQQQQRLHGLMGASSAAEPAVIIPELKIKGSDLLIVFDRANAKKNRIG